MVTSGRDPTGIRLRDWLDAGYVMLTENADPTARGLLDDLFEAASVDEMDLAFSELRSEMDYRQRQADEYEREVRERTGAPVHTRRVADGVLEAIVDEWAQIAAGAPEPEQDDV